VSICPGNFQALPEQTDRHHYGAWKILTVITQLTGEASTGGRAGKDRARGGQHGPRGGTGEEGLGRGKLGKLNGCIMHQVHTISQ